LVIFLPCCIIKIFMECLWFTISWIECHVSVGKSSYTKSR
jgi:hypothetical protein